MGTLECKLVKLDSVTSGTDWDCEYEFAGEIVCEECLVNGGRFDPRKPRGEQPLLQIEIGEGCTNIGSGGFHSPAYYDDGECAWCGTRPKD